VLAIESKVWAGAAREMTLYFDLDKIFVLNYILYVPVFKQHLISVTKLMDHGYLTYK
jgi:hypothetical protein